MSSIPAFQLRLAHALLRPAAHLAVLFHLPLRSLTGLCKLAHFEQLAERGLSSAEIARKLGQTARNVRLLAQHARSMHFTVEREAGLIRRVEDFIADATPMRQDVLRRFAAEEPAELVGAIRELLRDGRVVEGVDGSLAISAQFAQLANDQFGHRIDALNHHLDGLTQAIIGRLIHDRTRNTMIKTITFEATPEALAHYVARLEGELRRDIAALEEDAVFTGNRRRFTLGLTLASRDPSIE